MYTAKWGQNKAGLKGRRTPAFSQGTASHAPADGGKAIAQLVHVNCSAVVSIHLLEQLSAVLRQIGRPRRLHCDTGAAMPPRMHKTA
jgi:hypothetical protein